MNRFITLTKGKDCGYDGSNWSMGTNADIVFSPAVSPVQMCFVPADSTVLPEPLRSRFFFAASGYVRSSPGPGMKGDKSVLMVPYDADTCHADKPEPFLEYVGPDLQMPVGLALGPDALYVAPIFPAVDGTAAILRIALGGQVDTVAMFKLEERTRTESGGANNRNVSISPIPLSPQDAWGVAADGSVVLARVGDYHIDWVSTDGTVTSGTPESFRAVRIGTAEKEEYLAAQGRTGGGVGIRIGINNGEMQMSFQRGGGGGSRREIDQYQWPDRKPAMYSDRLLVDPLNRAWVRRHVDAGDPSTYDLFDRTGSLAGTVTLDHGKRVIGFGSGSVYVVAYDEFDLNYLERYALPST